MRRLVFASAIFASLAAAAVAAPLTKGKALAIMHDRHEGMEKIGDTNKLLRREITSSSPFMPAIQSGAATIAGLSVRANGWFPRGTGPEMGKTGAKPEIWQKPQDFAAKLHGFQAAARAFNAAAGADVDIMDLPRPERLGARDVVPIVRVATVDQDVVRRQIIDQRGDRLLHDRCPKFEVISRRSNLLVSPIFSMPSCRSCMMARARPLVSGAAAAVAAASVASNADAKITRRIITPCPREPASCRRAS